MTRDGIIEKIIYRNEENGYTVFSVSGDEGEEIFVGTLFGAGEGLFIIAEGDYVNHPQYSIQFKFTSCEIKLPTDIAGIERYLASGIVKGIGEIYAKRIVKKFGADTLRIMDEEPERLAEIKGISAAKARKIAADFSEKREFREVAIFLGGYGISVNLAMKIYNTYGDKVYEIVKKNPYRLAEDVQGVGFKLADQIAMRAGIAYDSEFRQRSALLYVLSVATVEGHLFLPKEELILRTVALVRGGQELPLDPAELFFADGREEPGADPVFEELSEQLLGLMSDLCMEGKLIVKNTEAGEACYPAANYYMELNSARILADLQLKYETDEKELAADIKKIEQATGVVLDETQHAAVCSAINAGVCVITGGPGTGKTTIIDTVIRYFEGRNLEIYLAAPTGRAAKRMTEQTGWPAQTIHRLLEFSGSAEDRGTAPRFGRNADNPLECDAIIVDEMSMVDAFLFYSLLQAVAYGTRLILVGDVHQLPSVGAGNVLKDIISSGCFPVSVLNTIHRQEEGSDIVLNAHKINHGEHILISNKSKDFFFIPKRTGAEVLNEVKELVSDNLPKYLKLSPLEIEVLAPMKRNEVGVIRLNQSLQALLNPPAPGKAERVRKDVIFRVGDKVMQIKNNYKQEWRFAGAYGGYGADDEQGIGVFNGDIGRITEISEFEQELTVLFDDGREAVYPFSALDELEHAFAMTIHKSQGSEYPAVVIPLTGGPKKMMNRNLLYTAITRAKRLVVIVGNILLVNQMIDNTEEQTRYTGLCARLGEIFALSDEH